MISSVPIGRSRVLDTTYFFAASIVRAKGSIPGFHPISAPPCRGLRPHAAFQSFRR